MGFKNDNQLTFTIRVESASNDNGEYKITLFLNGEKEKEYSFFISLTGFFALDPIVGLESDKVQELVHKNAVDVLLPYMRTQVSLLTAQPDTDCVVLPPMNTDRIIGISE